MSFFIKGWKYSSFFYNLFREDHHEHHGTVEGTDARYSIETPPGNLVEDQELKLCPAS